MQARMVKTHNSVSCGQVQLVRSHDRQVCILHECKKTPFSRICRSIKAGQKVAIFALELPRGRAPPILNLR